MFGVRIRRDETDESQGLLRVHVNEKGAIRSIEMASPLTSEEIGPALSQVFMKVSDLDEKARADRLEDVLTRARKSAGILERVSGKAQNRQTEALQRLPNEEFSGPAGPLVARVKGDFSVLGLSSASISAADAIAKCASAIEAARLVAEEAWMKAVEKEQQENEQQENEQKALPEPKEPAQ